MIEPITDRRRDWLWAMAVAAIVILSRVLLSEVRGFWLDEYHTLRAAQMSLPDMIANRLQAGHSPLYFLYARIGFILGTNEWMLRASSALAAGATTLLLTGLARTLGMRQILPALWGLCLFAPYWLSAGTEYRYMMPLIALTSLGALTGALYASAPTIFRGMAAAIALILILWTHATGAFAVFAIFLFFAWEFYSRHRNLKQTLLRCWPAWIAGASAVPMFLLLSDGAQGEKSRAIPDVGELFRDMAETVFGKLNLWPQTFSDSDMDYAIMLPGMLLIVAAAILAWKRLKAPGERTSARLLLAMLIGLPLGQVLFALTIKQTQGLTRYLAPFSVPAIMLLAFGWHAQWKYRRWFRGVFVVVVGLQFVGTAIYQGDRHREAMYWMSAHQQHENVMVSAETMNVFAAHYLNVANLDRWSSMSKLSGKIDSAVTRGVLREMFANETRGFVFLYHDKVNVHRRVDELIDEGFILDRKHLFFSDKVLIIPFIRDESERGWLDSLEATRTALPAEGNGSDYDL